MTTKVERASTRRIRLRMFKRTVWLCALNYGRTESETDRAALVKAVTTLDMYRQPRAAATPKREAREYYYRGEIERGAGRGYRLVAGYSGGGGGHIEYPWMTRRECQVQAKSEGFKARFVKTRGL